MKVFCCDARSRSLSLYSYAFEKEITMSTTDTRILGATAAELVGVRKEHQSLVFEIVSALNRRNPKNEEMIVELRAALYPHLQTVNAIRQDFQTLFQAGKLQYAPHFNCVINESKRGDKIEMPSVKFVGTSQISTERLNSHPLILSFNASQILAFVKNHLTRKGTRMIPTLFATITSKERYYTLVSERSVGDLFVDTWKSEEDNVFEDIILATQG